MPKTRSKSGIRRRSMRKSSLSILECGISLIGSAWVRQKNPGTGTSKK
jgi:hypothetical protein